MSEFDAQLRETVRQLGTTLGATIKHQLGAEWLETSPAKNTQICARIARVHSTVS